MRRRILTSLIVAAAVALFVYAFTLRGEDPDIAVSDQAVEALVPRPGAELEVQQVEIGVDLAPGWTGVLLVNGVEIPEDELRRVAAQNQFFFQPGPGLTFEQLGPGQVCAEAVIWRSLESRDRSRSVPWCFRVA